jgi:hypothetical protein
MTYTGPITIRSEPDLGHLDDDRTPFLVWGQLTAQGAGWTLSYIDQTDCVEEYFIPGDLADREHAIGSARNWLSASTYP